MFLYRSEAIISIGSHFHFSSQLRCRLNSILSPQISQSLKERLLEFHERAGLGFAAYDFLERGDDVIFLECNPGGAWLWLEESLGLRVSEHVARYLLGIDGTGSSWTMHKHVT